MRVEVDEPRRHQLARGVEQTLRARHRNIRFERLDHAKADSDVASSAQALAGVEHVAALDHEVELVVWAHGAVRHPHAGGSGEGERTCGGESLAARDGHGSFSCPGL